jgi:hypothetical protein
MTNKLHNRTLFVAALSVYFGLLIVGAPPQILAQQAKTASRIIVKQSGYAAECDPPELSNEASRRFEKFFALQGGSDGAPYPLPTTLEQYWANDEENMRGFYDLEVRLIFETKDQPPQYSIKIKTDHKNPDGSPRADELVEDAIRVAEILGLHQCQIGNNCSPLTFKLRFDKAELLSSIEYPQFSSEQAINFAQAYQLLIDEDICLNKDSATDSISKLLHDNTLVRAEANKVLVVTRLPRANLDKIFAKAGEKAN